MRVKYLGFVALIVCAFWVGANNFPWLSQTNDNISKQLGSKKAVDEPKTEKNNIASKPSKAQCETEGLQYASVMGASIGEQKDLLKKTLATSEKQENKSTEKAKASKEEQKKARNKKKERKQNKKNEEKLSDNLVSKTYVKTRGGQEVTENVLEYNANVPMNETNRVLSHNVRSVEPAVVATPQRKTRSRSNYAQKSALRRLLRKYPVSFNRDSTSWKYKYFYSYSDGSHKFALRLRQAPISNNNDRTLKPLSYSTIKKYLPTTKFFQAEVITPFADYNKGYVKMLVSANGSYGEDIRFTLAPSFKRNVDYNFLNQFRGITFANEAEQSKFCEEVVQMFIGVLQYRERIEGQSREGDNLVFKISGYYKDSRSITFKCNGLSLQEVVIDFTDAVI